ALRLSELVVAGKTDISQVALQWADDFLTPENATIHIRHSRTDQSGKGAHIKLG
ncbi:hypothetical protein JRQ81_016713, partial [Phrynocephalus forsythii]